MGYSQSTYIKAKNRLEIRRGQAREEQLARESECMVKYPDLLRIKREMAKTGASVGQALLKRGDVQARIQEIAKENLALQMEREEVLRMAGLPKDYLSVHYHCERCKDTGFVEGRFCDCHKQLMQEIELEKLERVAPVRECTFGAFRLDYYPREPLPGGQISPRQRMGEVLEYLKNYAEDFSARSPSLLLYGETGLGKTHLSLAVAQAAVRRGYSVIYDSAQNLLNQMEQEKFGRALPPEEGEKTLLTCDLLIVDDLGAEFSNSFGVSAVYNIVNTRLLAGRTTIISTNLSIKEMENRYTQRIASRIIGSYMPLRFYGRDVRQVKRGRS